MKSVTLVCCMLLSSWLFAQSSVDAVFAWDDDVICFVKGNEVSKFNKTQNKTLESVTLNQAFPGITFSKLDAVLTLDDKFYLFSGNQVICFNKTSKKMETTLPKSISSVWQGCPFDKIDAAMSYANGKVYFFTGTKYARFNASSKLMDANYPKTINNSTWPNLGFTTVDAAVTLSDGKCHFFKGEQYVRFDTPSDNADAGYPKAISEWNNTEGKSQTTTTTTTTTSESGIEFFHGTFDEALAKAKATNKLIFMDAYATWCGPCKWMAKNTFTNQTVGEYFNKNFICVKMDMERGEGPAIGRKYPVSAYPTLMFIDKNGKLVKSALGAHGVEDLMGLGKSVIASYR